MYYAPFGTYFMEKFLFNEIQFFYFGPLQIMIFKSKQTLEKLIFDNEKSNVEACWCFNILEIRTRKDQFQNYKTLFLSWKYVWIWEKQRIPIYPQHRKPLQSKMIEANWSLKKHCFFLIFASPWRMIRSFFWLQETLSK